MPTSAPTPSFRWIGLAAVTLAFPLLAQAQQAFTNVSLNLRAGPSTDYPAVAVLRGGQPLDVLGCTGGYSWCDVVLPDGLRGWVFSEGLDYAHEQQRVPLAVYGAAIGVPIVAFTLGNYWSNHYRDRPFYGDRRWWGGRPPPPVQGWRPPPPPRPDWRPNSNWRPGPGGPGPNFRPRPDRPPPPGPGFRPPRDDNFRPRPDPGFRPPDRRPDVRPDGRPGMRPDGRPGGRPDMRPDGPRPSAGGDVRPQGPRPGMRPDGVGRPSQGPGQGGGRPDRGRGDGDGPRR